MSETQTEKETEMVAGTIGGITLKKEGTWTVAVMPEGSQYAKNLWTKDSELVASLAQKQGQAGVFACNVSHWTNSEGKPVRSLWIAEGNPDEVTLQAVVKNQQNATPSGSPAPEQEGMTPAKWDAKERRDYRSRAWAQTLAAFQHTIKVDEDPEDVFARLQPFQRKVFTDVCQSFSFPADESDIPF